jgi:hypothetical protein
MMPEWLIKPLFYARLGAWLAWVGWYFVAGGRTSFGASSIDRGFASASSNSSSGTSASCCHSEDWRFEIPRSDKVFGSSSIGGPAMLPPIIPGPVSCPLVPSVFGISFKSWPHFRSALCHAKRPGNGFPRHSRGIAIRHDFEFTG